MGLTKMGLNQKTRVVSLGDFEFHTFSGDVIIQNKDNSNIQISPAESSRVNSLFNTIGGMLDFNALPSNISQKPFAITFHSDGRALIVRDSEDKGLEFNMTDVDDLIKGINMAVQKIRHKNHINGGPSQGNPTFGSPEPLIEGR